MFSATAVTIIGGTENPESVARFLHTGCSFSAHFQRSDESRFSDLLVFCRAVRTYRSPDPSEDMELALLNTSTSVARRAEIENDVTANTELVKG